MKLKFVLIAAAATYLIHPASAQDADLGQFRLLEGDERLACEATLCLSSSIRPGQCTPSLQRYFNITRRTFTKTMNARRDFLSLCPVASRTPQMQSLIYAISRGAGYCDLQMLNAMGYEVIDPESGTSRFVISNAYPWQCSLYFFNVYDTWQQSGTLPRYVGEPERGGFWVEAANYDQALAEYQARIAAEDAASGRGNGVWWR